MSKPTEAEQEAREARNARLCKYCGKTYGEHSPIARYCPGVISRTFEEVKQKSKAGDRYDKFIKINVNGKDKVWIPKLISTEDVVTLAYGVVDSAATYTVTYARGKNKTQDMMLPGQSVSPINGQVFNVSVTNLS